MDIDERIMDKVLADVKEIIAEPDGTIRFIFYIPQSEEVEDISEKKMVEDIYDNIDTLRNIIISKEHYITKLMSEINDKDKTIKLLEEKLAGVKND